MEATMTPPKQPLMVNGTCIDMCMKCAQVCEECFNLCLQEADAKQRIDCIKSLQDCADICVTAARFMARGSGNIEKICCLCSLICESCATECDMFKDQHCHVCADTCRQCAAECKNMENNISGMQNNNPQ